MRQAATPPGPAAARPVERRISAAAAGSALVGAAQRVGRSRREARHPQAFADGQAVEDAGDLEFAADAEGDDPFGGEPADVVPMMSTVPVDGSVPSADAAHQRRLAGAVGADEADSSPCVTSRSIPRGPEAAEGLAEPADRQSRPFAGRGTVPAGVERGRKVPKRLLAGIRAAADAKLQSPGASPSGSRMIITTKSAPTIRFHRKGRSPESWALR